MKTAPLALFLAALACAPAASAADDLVTGEAKQRMTEGKKLYGEGKYDAAWLKYVEACVVLKSDGCTRGLAFTAFKSGRYLAAYGYSEQLLEPSPKPSLAPAVVAELTRMKHDAYAKIGHLDISAPPGAIVVLDEEMLGRAPLGEPTDVDASEHTVVANIAGHASTQRVSAVAGTITRVRFDEPPAPEPSLAAVVAAPAPSLPSPPATTSALTLAPLEPVDAPTARASNPWHTWLPLGLGVGALAAAGVGTAFVAQSTHDAHQADALRSGLPTNACAAGTSASCAALASAIQGRDHARTEAIVSFAGAGALAAGAVLTFLLIPEQTGERSAIVPMTDRHTFGAGWVTTF